MGNVNTRTLAPTTDNVISTLPEELVFAICQYLTLPALFQFSATNKKHRAQVFRFLSDKGFLQKQLGLHHPLQDVVPSSENILNPNQPHWPLLAWEASRRKGHPPSPLLISIASGAPENLLRALQSTMEPHQYYPETPAAISQSILALDDEAQTREALYLLAKTLASDSAPFNAYGPQGNDRLAARVMRETLEPAALLRQLASHGRAKLIEIMRDQASPVEWVEWLSSKNAEDHNALECATIAAHPRALKALLAVISGERSINLLIPDTPYRDDMLTYAAAPDGTKTIRSLLRHQERTDVLLLDLANLPEPSAIASLCAINKRMHQWLSFYTSVKTIIAQPDFFAIFMTHMNLFQSKRNTADSSTAGWYWWTTAAGKNPSLLWLLSQTCFLETLMKAENDHLFSGFITAMNTQRPNAADSYYTNTSGWHWLSGTHDGQKIFLHLLTTKGFLQKIMDDEPLFSTFIDAMSERRNQAAGINQNTSGWYWLSETHHGQKIFLQLLTTQGFLQKIMDDEPLFSAFIDAMSARQTQIAGINQNTSGWYWLTHGSNEHINLLSLLLTPGFMGKLMSNDALVKGFIEAMGAQTSSPAPSGWGNLNTHAAGIGTLSVLWGSPGFLQKIVKHSPTTVLLRLIHSANFKQSLIRDDTIFSAFIEAMNTPRRQNGDIEECTSGWYALSNTRQTTKTLLLLLTTPGFLQKLVAEETLFKGFSEAMEAPADNYIKSAWYRLTYAGTHIGAFTAISNTPDLLQKLITYSRSFNFFVLAKADSFRQNLMNDDTLFRAFIECMNEQDPTDGADKNTSRWYALSNNCHATETLFLLLTTSGFLQKLMTEEDLLKGFIEAMEAPADNYIQSAWYRLTYADTHIGAFTAISNTPGLLQNLIIYSRSFNFFVLAKTDSFRQNLMNDGALFRAFIKRLNAPLTQAAGADKNLSGWHMLSDTYHARETLVLLLNTPGFMKKLMGEEDPFEGFIAAMGEKSSPHARSAWALLNLGENNEQPSTSQPSHSSLAFWQQPSPCTPNQEDHRTAFIQAVNARIQNTSTRTFQIAST